MKERNIEKIVKAVSKDNESKNHETNFRRKCNPAPHTGIQQKPTGHSLPAPHTPDIVIVNPTFGGWFDLPSFKADHSKNSTKYIALVCSVIDNNALKEYDESIAICDDLEAITGKINHLLHAEEEEEKDNEQETLSQREKEIITCVVKGMTNKAIADKLYLSIHTVITHRRNIARKLQIHSPAGLTIYAIVNKLVELQDIKDSL